MGAFADKCVDVLARLLATSSRAPTRLTTSAALGTVVVAGTLGGMLVALLLVSLPNPIVDFTAAPGWARLKTLLLFTSLVGGALGGVCLLAYNELLLNSFGYTRVIVASLVLSSSAVLAVGIHCMSAHDAPRCGPNMEWLALGAGVGLTTTLSMSWLHLRQPPAPISLLWRSLCSPLAGLVAYESVHLASVLKELRFPHMGRGLVTAAASSLYLLVVTLGLWLRAGGSRLLLEAMVEGNQQSGTSGPPSE